MVGDQCDHIRENALRQQPGTHTRCELCLAVTHDTKDCSQQDVAEHGIEGHLKSMEQIMQALVPPHPCPPVKSSGEVCRKWNQGECNYPFCRHTRVRLVWGNSPRDSMPQMWMRGSWLQPLLMGILAKLLRLLRVAHLHTELSSTVVIHS